MQRITTIMGALSCAVLLAGGCGSADGSDAGDFGPGMDAADIPTRTDIPHDPGTPEVIDASDARDVAPPCLNDGDCAIMQTGECTAARCNPASSVCELVNVQDGTACQTGSKCLLDASCQSGRCTGTPVRCDDGNPCTDNGCSAETGCQFLPNQNDCDDDNPCTTGDRCSMGICEGAANICECLGDSDCTEVDDPDRCRGTLVCRDNACVLDPESARPCPVPEDAPCVVSVCDRESGRCIPRHASDGIPCQADTRCIIGAVCLDGACQGGTSLDCDDGNPCTDDRCDPLSGCVFTPNQNDCNDGNGCTVDDKCVEGICIGDLTAACGCFRGSDCAPFEDGNRCNGILSCVAGQCTVDRETIIRCELPPDSQCLRTECLPGTGECLVSKVPDGRPCDDGNACTLVDSCSDGICLGEIPVVCTALDQCHLAGTCDYLTGLCSNPPAQDGTDCDDQDPCTIGDACMEGICEAAPVVCEALDQCHLAGTCDLDTGLCSNPAAQDGTDCDDRDPCTTGDACMDGICLEGDPVVCEALDQCHVPGTCDPDTGLCLDPAAEDGTECSDGDPCTMFDSCLEGTCTPGPADPCDDDNPDTFDWCEPGYGCRHIRQGDRCEHPFDLVPRPVLSDIAHASNLDDDSTRAVDDDWIFGTTDGFLPDYTFDCGPGFALPDVVYRFTTPRKTGFRADLYSGSSASHLLVALRDDCNNPATMACDFQTPSDPDQWASIETLLEPGTYYLMIQSLGTGGGAFGLQASYVSLCNEVTCEDRGPCTWSYCDEDTGSCIYQQADDGYYCWLDYCHSETSCQGGECVGTPLDCDDDDPETVDDCDPDWGCTYRPVNDRCEGALKIPAEGTQAIYGDIAYANFDYTVPCALPYNVPDVVYAFTLEDWTRLNATLVFADIPDSYTTLALQYEQCGGNEFVACDIQFMTQDPANINMLLGPGTYFLHVGGLGMSSYDYRLEVVFEGPCDILDCDDNNPCTEDICDREIGECVHKILDGEEPCELDPCMEKEVCVEGMCRFGFPKNCDDGNSRTVDGCDPETGCWNVLPGDDCRFPYPVVAETQIIPGSTRGLSTDYPDLGCDDLTSEPEIVFTFELTDRAGFLAWLEPIENLSFSELIVTSAPCDRGETFLCASQVPSAPDAEVSGVLEPGRYWILVRQGYDGFSDFNLHVTFDNPCKVLDCNDNDPCTEDRCDREIGYCMNEPISGPGCP